MPRSITDNDLRVLEQRSAEACARSPVTGAALAILRDAEVVYMHAFGALDLEAPLPVASLSKPVFACVVLLLRERGLIDLDKPLPRYLPGPYLPDEPWLPSMTARHALSHTTGFPNWRDETGLRAAFRPGSAFHYSAEGLIYLQAVVEHLTGQPLEDTLRALVFEPLGMRHSTLVPEDLSGTAPFLPVGRRAYGATGLHATARDYARFLAAMLDPCGEGRALLSRASIDEMLTPQIRVGDQHDLAWGLGWGLQNAGEDGASFWHWGARRRLTRSFALGQRSERRGVVVFTDHADGLPLCQELVQLAMGHAEPYPAFRWLLPAERWRADGRAA